MAGARGSELLGVISAQIRTQEVGWGAGTVYLLPRTRTRCRCEQQKPFCVEVMVRCRWLARTGLPTRSARCRNCKMCSHTHPQNLQHQIATHRGSAKGTRNWVTLWQQKRCEWCKKSDGRRAAQPIGASGGVYFVLRTSKACRHTHPSHVRRAARRANPGGQSSSRKPHMNRLRRSCRSG